MKGTWDKVLNLPISRHASCHVHEERREARIDNDVDGQEAEELEGCAGPAQLVDECAIPGKGTSRRWLRGLPDGTLREEVLEASCTTGYLEGTPGVRNNRTLHGRHFDEFEVVCCCQYPW